MISKFAHKFLRFYKTTCKKECYITYLGLNTTFICSTTSKHANEYGRCQTNNEFCNYQEQQDTI